MSQRNDSTSKTNNLVSNNSRNRIIDYWDKAQLCSLESSTSQADPDLAYLDNAIENRILQQILDSYAVGRCRCLDVGAGYGRFAELFRGFYSEVVLLEAAERIYDKLVKLWSDRPGIRCHKSDFESYVDEKKYDLIFASGVLYLYSDEQLYAFAKKAVSMLTKEGLFVLRDFLSVQKPQVFKSNYIKDGFCYYRTPQFWMNFATRFGLELRLIKRSKPRICLLRYRCILRIMEKLRLKWCYRCRPVLSSLMHLGNFRVGGRGIQTVFIVMSVK
ncbi:MAG: class I SAM-dependent methyltransferase [Sedimentisphaerales bacterium]|nr:class I SAM-dependent methyltransferase [Sedimentisphaerales bacterium]